MAISVTTLSDWNYSVAEAITSVGSAVFPEKMELALSKLIDFDICMVFSYSSEKPSNCLYHDLDAKSAKVIVEDYLAGPYLLDPFYSAAIRGKRNGFGAMRSLAPDQFYRSEFYRHHYVRTGIADEIGMFFSTAPDTISVLSIARQKPMRPFTVREKKTFGATSNILSSIAASHWSVDKQVKSNLGTEATIKAVFDNFGLGVLTVREKEIVALILKGHSSGSIGQVLGISEGTVKNHRKKVYDKLQISSQAELFSMFLGSLQKKLSS